MKLVIVESPSKTKTVGKYLGNEYLVLSSVGHIRDLPKSQKGAIDIENDFAPHYIISEGKGRVIKDLVAAAKKSDEVILATDPDREGEAISWHIAEVLKDELGNKLPKISRITYNEITQKAVQDAMLHPRDIDQNLRKAQEARRVLDRLVGYELSGLVWKKVKYGLSAGRVQSPALRIVMEREREIRAFVPVWYGLIFADCVGGRGDTGPGKHTGSIAAPALRLTCETEFDNPQTRDTVVAAAQQHDWRIASVTNKQEERAPKPPFTTSTLQQTASTRLGFSPSRTMRAAQKLYEQGLITYMRTDSPSLSKDAHAMLCGYIEDNYGKESVQFRTYKSKSKNAQEAHEAIRPTNAKQTFYSGDSDQEKLYELIWTRAISSQFKSATVMRTKITSVVELPPSSGEAETEGLYPFSANGSVVIDPGWLVIDTKARTEDTELPTVSEGEILTLDQISTEDKFTTPPNRYSEAGLIKELEKRGIGRPSTYASIIQTLVERTYVTKEGRTLIPTDTGDVVSSFLEEHFESYISDDFTAEMEEDLDKVADGQKEYATVLSRYYFPLHQAVTDKESLPKATNLGIADSIHQCPKCGSGMVIKLGSTGKFLSCDRYPDCDGALSIDGTELSGDTPLGVDPVSGKNVYILSGRFGPYVQLGETPAKIPKVKNVKGAKSSGAATTDSVLAEPISAPRRASLPPRTKPADVTLEMALHLLVLPRSLGIFPETGEELYANIGRFGPYVGAGAEFRSLKKGDDPYTITYERALEIISTPKALPKGVIASRELGINAKTKRKVTAYQDKKGVFTKIGLKRNYLGVDTLDEISDAIIDTLINPPAPVKKKTTKKK
jgi:DNA topoisomerase-1